MKYYCFNDGIEPFESCFFVFHEDMEESHRNTHQHVSPSGDSDKA